jgi:acetyl-CoA acyltransferase
MRDAVIAAAVRTPIGRRNGGLSAIHPADLSAVVLRELMARAAVGPELVEDVVWGCVTQTGEQTNNIGRAAVLAAGWPDHIPGTTIDRQCGSGQQAVHFAAAMVQAGHCDMVVAGGVESMSRVPMGSTVRQGPGHPVSEAIRRRYPTPFNQGRSAEAIAERWGFSRQQLDEYALESHQRAAAATDQGLLAGQIVPCGELASDEGIRRDTSAEKLAGLPSVFSERGPVTAGNSSQMSDGSAALLVTTSDRAAALGLTPLARVHTAVAVGSDPELMLTGPIPATELALRRAGLRIDEIGAFEVNEAFASIPLAWLAETGADPKATNPLGGAIAVGHPLGGSGAVLATRLLHHMRDNGIRYGLQTMCEGGGMANATVFELL